MWTQMDKTRTRKCGGWLLLTKLFIRKCETKKMKSYKMRFFFKKKDVKTVRHKLEHFTSSASVNVWSGSRHQTVVILKMK